MGKLILDAILARLDALETAVLGRPRTRVSKAALAREEDCTPRSVMRKVKTGALPAPDMRDENGRLYWWSDNLEQHRRTRRGPDTAAARAARNPQLRKPKPHPSLET